MRYSFIVSVIVSVVMLHIFSTVVSAQPTPDYYPLKSGSEWTLTGYGTTPTMTRKVVGTEIIDGIEYAKIETFTRDKNDPEGQKLIAYMRCDENKIYMHNPPKKEELEFDFNSKISEAWITSIAYSNGAEGKRTGRIIGKDMTVTVPAGVFEGCIVYEITEGAKSEDMVPYVVHTYWLAPDVGIVKMSVNFGGSIAPIDLWVNDLTSFHISDN